MLSFSRNLEELTKIMNLFNQLSCHIYSGAFGIQLVKKDSSPRSGVEELALKTPKFYDNIIGFPGKMSKIHPALIKIDILDLMTNKQREIFEKSCKQKSDIEIKSANSLERSSNHKLQEDRKNIYKQFKYNKKDQKSNISRNYEIEISNKDKQHFQMFTTSEKKEDTEIKICREVKQNINKQYSTCSNQKNSFTSELEIDSSNKVMSKGSKSSRRNSKLLENQNIHKKSKRSLDYKQYYSQIKNATDIKHIDRLPKKYSAKKKSRKDKLDKSVEIKDSLAKSKLDMSRNHYKSYLTNNGQKSTKQISNVKSHRSKSFILPEENLDSHRKSLPNAKCNRLKFSEAFRGSTIQNSIPMKNVECSSNPSTNIYKLKLTKELENVLNLLDLQVKDRVDFQELEKILTLMNMMAPVSKNIKWKNTLNNVWEMLSMSKRKISQVSIRSIKIFILGICGIDYQELNEISEIDSTPSASTKESKSFDEFIFTTKDHLETTRLQFYEMILHKLTSSIDSNEESEIHIRRAKSFHLNTMKKEKIKLDFFKNKTPRAQKSKIDEDLNKNKFSNPLRIVPKNLNFDTALINNDNSISKSNCSEKDENNSKGKQLKSFGQAPILNFSVHIGQGEIRELNIYNKDTMYKEAEDFCKLHNLPQKKLDLLISILNDDAQNTLAQIDEEDEEFD